MKRCYLHDKHPDSIGGGLAQVQRFGGPHHYVDDGDHKPAQNQEGHDPVDVLNVLPCTHDRQTVNGRVLDQHNSRVPS